MSVCVCVCVCVQWRLNPPRKGERDVDLYIEHAGPDQGFCKDFGGICCLGENKDIDWQKGRGGECVCVMHVLYKSKDAGRLRGKSVRFFFSFFFQCWPLHDLCNNSSMDRVEACIA